MTGFFIKKAFFDGWDNMVVMVLYNLGYIALVVAFWASLTLGLSYPALTCVLMVLILFAFSVFCGGISHTTHAWAFYEHDSWANFRSGISRNFRHAVLYFFVLALLAVMIFIVMPFYFQMANAFGIIVTVVLFWVVLTFTLSLCYFWPLTELLPGDRPLKTLKKCFVIMMDNLGFTIFFAIYRLVLFILTLATMGLIPGGCGLALAHQVAGKLIMMKYDYLEANPGTERKHLPWEDILFEEREKVGPRSFKSMIFPWKD
jgi:hypothetical protein